jgi:glycosyltransferase involved in cell wall biosynthesis
LIKNGFEVDVLTGKPNYPEGEIYAGYKIFRSQMENKFGASVFRVPLIPRGKNNKLQLALNYISFILFGLTIGSYLVKDKKYDLIFVYGLSPIMLSIPGIYISKIKKIKLVIWVQDLWPESLTATKTIESKPIINGLRKIVKWIYGCADLILVQSKAFIPAIHELTNNSKIEYYPNSVDPFFYDNSLMKENNTETDMIDEKYFNVVFAGNVGIGQGMEVIVEAAKSLLKIQLIRFVVIGNGSRLEWLINQKKIYQLDNIIVTGRLPIESMPPIMRKASALLVTLTDEPIFRMTVPNKIQAYLAVGRPIIACLNGEGARIVEQAKAGKTVPAGDYRSLAEAVLELHVSPIEDRNKYGINGRNFYLQNFEHDMLIDQLIVRLQNLVKVK